MFARGGPTFLELARQALSSTERGYDLLAPKFDKTPFRTPAVVLRGMLPLLERIGPIGSAVDLCCGTGAATEALVPHVRDRIVGLDVSRGMLDQAEKNLAAVSPPPTVTFVRADVLTAAPEEVGGPFDLAVTFGAHGHILPRDERMFVRQVHRLLAPGGRFLFVTSYHPPVWSPAYLIPQAFNAAMWVRNRLIRPPFIMYYLTFLLPEARDLLEETGFEVREHRDAYTGLLSPLVLVEAIKRAG